MVREDIYSHFVLRQRYEGMQLNLLSVLDIIQRKMSEVFSWHS